MPATALHTGQTLHGFRITDIIPIAELNATLFRLRHEKTGARMVHLATEDPNNLFAVGFRTPPADSTGVAHILEHTVLCGSRRYPVRDPFFTMLKRSLNTFMNAMTASDWTLYPFSSQNTKDFYNLLDIYLDAAFFPLLRERDFRQEGHRIEFARPDDPQSPLEFKGVVYNEMKGAMASPPSLLGRRLAKALYPTTTYGHNSGGEPAEIPDLTWEALRTFHASYYHPSNAWFYTCGNLPLEKHLAVIESRVLSQFERREVQSEVPPEIRFDAPRSVTETFPLAPGEETGRRSLVQVGWLTCDISDSFERLALTILSSLLVGNPAAPLYKALLDSGLGDNLAPGTGYNDDNRTTYFAAG
ncbi:MAG TPA: insulinase family protein, partial [Deferrimonas sp.]